VSFILLSGVCCLYSSEGDTEQKRELAQACTFVKEKYLSDGDTTMVAACRFNYLGFGYPLVVLGEDNPSDKSKNGYKLKIWDCVKDTVKTIDSTKYLCNFTFSRFKTYLAYRDDCHEVHLLNLLAGESRSFPVEQDSFDSIKNMCFIDDSSRYLTSLAAYTPLCPVLHNVVIGYLEGGECLAIAHESGISLFDVWDPTKKQKTHEIVIPDIGRSDAIVAMQSNNSGGIVAMMRKDRGDSIYCSRHDFYFLMIEHAIGCSAKPVIVLYKENRNSSFFCDKKLCFLSDGSPACIGRNDMDVFDKTTKSFKFSQSLPFTLSQGCWSLPESVGFFRDKNIVFVKHRAKLNDTISSIRTHSVRGEKRETVLREEGGDSRCRVDENHVITEEDGLIRLHQLTKFASEKNKTIKSEF
jgi:hypothetical protein